MQNNIPIPNKQNNYWINLSGSSIALNITNFFHIHKKPILVITTSILEANNLYKAIKFFIGSEFHENIIIFPDRETLPYDQLSPHKDITSERLSILSSLQNIDSHIIIVSINTAMNLLPPVDFINKYTFNMQVNQTLNLEEFKLRLTKSGYRQTNQVVEHGEYCVKGGIIDLFPMGHTIPYRIELFDNQIESIRKFDPETQLSNTNVNSLSIMPAYEYQLTDSAIDIFKTRYKNEFNNNPKNCPIYQSIRNKLPAPGAEYYLPLFFEETASVFDYLNKETIIIALPNALDASKEFYQQVKERYDFINNDKIRPILQTHVSFLSTEKVFHQINRYNNLKILPDSINKKNAYDFNCSALEKFNIDLHIEKPMNVIKLFIEDHINRILIVANSKGRQEIILALLEEIGIFPTQVKHWDDFIQSKDKVCIVSGDTLNGCILNNEKITIITEYELFGYQTKLTNQQSKQLIDSKYILKIWLN
jgi:transcription-repair coupling factor (superfamily II helicase)